MTHFPPTEGPVGVASTILKGQTVLNLKRSRLVRDAFSGKITAALAYASQQSLDVLGDGFIQGEGKPFNADATPDYHVALIFDKKACLFTGIVYRHEDPVFADAVEWAYDGMRIEGKCLFTNPLKPDGPVPRYVVHGYSTATLTYMESNEATAEEESAAA